MSMVPTVVLHYDEDGEMCILASSGVRVICVSEQAHDDRVYQMQPSSDEALIDRLIAGAVIGHADDGKSNDLRRKLRMMS